jgi:hypothetical protein
MPDHPERRRRMSTEKRVVSLAARKASESAALDEKLLAAYRDAKARDDGRRVRRSELEFAERKRL